ncbi:MAG TPA: YiiX/YebB-like N1pC/P60 family cysteine hydrolase [Denitromonas sp.]|uniref:YiiX/YebB-like N1pC/P60 family cysteine hydrolase n=1 Tax=Denitromonas sp. TaxID=2734609 RepID=UPI001DC3FA2B|nr:lipo-like protein [Rhodocyclaceae bacterium]MCP5221339.1 lipo-like protein [Zoogloeaceae bacterium]HQU89850.1 YiiX/YebB-like N1pC/P60 family cysteine hydrolase [Denitromonas sp.]HQV16085.1 YiiX/YebB-like N1pC/P60 family cysteine hydrolase [Denitromonas sp.]
MANRILRGVGRWLAGYLNAELPSYTPLATHTAERLQQTLLPGDILLVEGNRRISAAIKYLTQSTWSHAALYIGSGVVSGQGGDSPLLIEADTEHGVVVAPLSKYDGMHTRICRPVALSDEDRQALIAFAVARIGHQYDLKNIFDLVRYLLPTPPVPTRFRRDLLSMGSGEPTRAICSTLIAQAFQSIGYPILPAVYTRPSRPGDPAHCNTCETEVLRVRHHSLFTPRDFDISPYFAIIKPTIEGGFDYQNVVWGAPCVSNEPPAGPPLASVGNDDAGADQHRA